MTRKALVTEDSNTYHGIRRGRVKCGGRSYDDGDVVPVETANEMGLEPCGNCWRNKSLRRRVAARGVDEAAS